MKKLLLSIFVLLTWSVSHSQDLPNHGSEYVNDFANIIDDDKQTLLEQKVRDLEKKTSIELSVVTIKTLDGRDIDSYAHDLFAKWGIGKCL